jgi:hypothetical protein
MSEERGEGGKEERGNERNARNSKYDTGPRLTGLGRKETILVLLLTCSGLVREGKPSV